MNTLLKNEAHYFTDILFGHEIDKDFLYKRVIYSKTEFRGVGISFIAKIKDIYIYSISEKALSKLRLNYVVKRNNLETIDNCIFAAKEN